MKQITFQELIKLEDPDKFLDSVQPFMKLLMQYKCAMLEVQTKFEVLNNELSLYGDQNPILSVSSRIKKASSIIEKLNRRNLEVSLESIEKNIYDIAGIRIICAFVKDIYALADNICSQDDITLIERKDYIKNPKPNGYRSLHLILEVPVFFLNETKHMKVEIQLRTIAMDSWASLEHKMRYKKDIEEEESIYQDLKQCAEELHHVDLKMGEINHRIMEQNQRSQQKPAQLSS